MPSQNSPSAPAALQLQLARACSRPACPRCSGTGKLASRTTRKADGAACPDCALRVVSPAAAEPETAVSAVHMYGPRPNGERSSEFSVGSIKVLLTPADAEHNEDAFELACEFSRSRATLAALRAEVEQLKSERDAARDFLREFTAPTPARLLGTGYVRFAGAQLWLLGKRETGFSAFGYRCADWDELFRRFNVRVTGHGTDEHGAWWSVENAQVSP